MSSMFQERAMLGGVMPDKRKGREARGKLYLGKGDMDCSKERSMLRMGYVNVGYPRGRLTCS